MCKGGVFSFLFLVSSWVDRSQIYIQNRMEYLMIMDGPRTVLGSTGLVRRWKDVKQNESSELLLCILTFKGHIQAPLSLQVVAGR